MKNTCIQSGDGGEVPSRVRFSETAELFLRADDSYCTVPITGSDKPAIPDGIKAEWQKSLNILSKVLSLRISLITYVDKTSIMVFLGNSGSVDIYPIGSTEPLKTGLFCETVLGKNRPLKLNHAMADPVWKDSPDIALNMTNYGGVPLCWSDGAFFGTLCILDSGDNIITDEAMELLDCFKRSIENDIELLRIRMQNEEQQEGYETAMDALFRFAPGGIFSYSADGDELFSYISSNMLSFLGYTHDEFVEKFNDRFPLMVWHEDRERVQREIAEQIRHSSYDTCEYRIERKDGSLVWVHDEGHIVTGENGRRWFYVVIVDITDSVETRQKLLTRNRQLEQAIRDRQTTVDMIPGGIRMFRRENGRIVCVNANKYFADMIGVSKEELIGESFGMTEARVHPDDVLRHYNETVKSLSEKHRTEGTYRFMNVRTGEYRWYHLEALLLDQGDGVELAYFHYTDVDDLKKAEENIKRSSEQYSLAVNGAHLSVWEYDIENSRLIIPNGEGSTFTRARYGFTSDIVENVPECMLPMGLTDKDRENFLRLFDEVRSGMEYATTDVWFRKSSHDEPCCDRITYYVIKDGSGKPVRAYGVGVDITAAKKDQLRFHTAIQTILAANPESLCTFQINLTRDLCYEGHGISSYILSSLQSNTASGLFKNGLALIPFEDDRRRFAELLDRDSLLSNFREGAGSLHVDYRRNDVNGVPFWVRTFINLLKNPESGEIEGVIYSLDISREKRRQEMFDIITGEEYDLIALLDVDTGIVELVHINSRLSPGYGNVLEGPGSLCYFSQFRRNCADAWVAPDERQRYLEGTDLSHIRRELDKNGRYELNIRSVAGGGVTYRKLSHYYLNDSKKSILLINSDVTPIIMQQHELENEKLLRMEATAANEAKSEFLSRMSHDMRTPLNGIIGMTYITDSMELPPNVRENLGKIDTSSKFLLGLINDVLDMTKAESKSIELHPEPYSPQEFYDYIDAVIKPLCREKGQVFTIEANPPVDRIPVFDKLRINQIVFNLLSNAVKYTPEGGKISYSARFGRLDSDNRVPLQIEVRDTGIGMSDEFQKILFEPFAQEGRSDGSGKSGTGLGLSIMKRLVDLMDGAITVTSSVGNGTTFTIDLTVDTADPSALADTGGNAAERPVGNVLFGKHILLCEDHPLNQEIAKTLLERRGMIVEIANDGRRGADAFKSSPNGFFDAILMDLRMPVMGGYEATELIRSLDRPDAAKIPIIAMTADAFDDDVKKCLDAGMTGHIPKPIDPQILYGTLESILK